MLRGRDDACARRDPRAGRPALEPAQRRRPRTASACALPIAMKFLRESCLTSLRSRA